MQIMKKTPLTTFSRNVHFIFRETLKQLRCVILADIHYLIEIFGAGLFLLLGCCRPHFMSLCIHKKLSFLFRPKGADCSTKHCILYRMFAILCRGWCCLVRHGLLPVLANIPLLVVDLLNLFQIEIKSTERYPEYWPHF